MFIEFSVGNFRSIKEIQSLNMTTAKINELRDSNTIKISEKFSVLKSKAIYGANASGKSNFIKALIRFKKIVRNSVKNETILQLIEKFQFSTETENTPSFFQLIFIHDSIQYRYGFEATNKKIVSEWLFGTPGQREVCFFTRENNIITEVSEKHYNEGKRLIFGEDNEIYRDNSLFLSTVATMNGRLSIQLIEKITSIIIIKGLDDDRNLGNAIKALTDENQKDNINVFLQLADTGINKLEAQKILISQLSNKPVRVIFSSHDKYEEKKKTGTKNLLFLQTQSEGTIKMFKISPFLMTALSEGRTIIIDEFDARFHPLITKKIVQLFNSVENTNAQLVFVTHDTNLLSHELLRRDQIDFVEKDTYGASHIYTLVQFKGIRNNASFEKDYIAGKYGAIPFMGDFTKLIKKNDNA